MDKKIIEKTVKESRTINEVLTKMGRNTSSGAYKSFKKYIAKNNIDTSHFLTQKEVIEKMFSSGKLKKIPNNEMFITNSLVTRSVIKNRILRENLLEYKCVFCYNNGEWMGKKISLILDHINGKNNDHRLENLRFVCPNCNSTLDTHCRGTKKRIIEGKKERKKFTKKYKERINLRKVERPDLETLKKQINELGYVKTGKIYGVSDNSIRNWIKWYNKALVV